MSVSRSIGAEICMLTGANLEEQGVSLGSQADFWGTSFHPESGLTQVMPGTSASIHIE